MIDINELREAIQTFGSQAINEGDLNELLDRLELTESIKASYKNAFEISENTVRNLTEKVIPNIRKKLETAEKERDDVAMQLAQSEQGKRKISKECDSLLARIEAMEQQEPVD